MSRRATVSPDWTAADKDSRVRLWAHAHTLRAGAPAAAFTPGSSRSRRCSAPRASPCSLSMVSLRHATKRFAAIGRRCSTTFNPRAAAPGRARFVLRSRQRRSPNRCFQTQDARTVTGWGGACNSLRRETKDLCDPPTQQLCGAGFAKRGLLPTTWDTEGVQTVLQHRQTCYLSRDPLVFAAVRLKVRP